MSNRRGPPPASAPSWSRPLAAIALRAGSIFRRARLVAI